MEIGGAVRSGEEDLRSYKRNLGMNKYIESYHFWLTLRLKSNVENGIFSEGRGVRSERSGKSVGMKKKKKTMMEKRASTPSPMDIMGGSRDEEDGSCSRNVTTMRTAETLLRLVPMTLCIAALVVMLKNSQTNDYGSLSYSDLGAFRYLVHVNGICAGYSLLSAVIVAMPRPCTMSRAWTFFFLDQVFTYVILAAGAVSLELVYLAYKGDTEITWSAACGSFGAFCHKATASIALTFVAVACYAVISLISSYKLFSRYDAPVANSSNIAAF